MTTLLAATQHGVARVTGSESGAWSAEWPLAGDARCLAVSGSTVFAGVDGLGIFRSEDAGQTWSNAGLDGHAVRSLAVRGDLVVAGTREPRVHASRDGGASWSPLARFPRWRSWWWAQPAERPFRPSYVSALAITASSIVAGIEACGVLVSRDGGASWSGHRRAALRDCHELRCDGETVFEAGSGGLAESSDDGLTWRRRRDGLDRRYGWSLAADEEEIYLTVAPYRSSHSHNSRACIVRSRGGAPWVRVSEDFSTLPRLASGVRGSVFAALGDGTLLRSPDHGDSWKALPVNLGGWSRALAVVEP